MLNQVYRITSPSGKYYIGSTNDLERRLNAHKTGKDQGNKYLASAYSKYGDENMTVDILGEYETREDAYIAEQGYLDNYYDDPLCLNFNRNAVGFSSEVARAGGKANKGKDPEYARPLLKWAQENPELAYNMKREQALKLNAKKKGVPAIKTAQTQRGSTHIEVILPDGSFGGYFRTIKELQSLYPELKSSGNISSVLNGLLRHYKKYKLLKVNLPEDEVVS